MQPIALIVDRDADTRCMYAEYLKFTSWRSEQAADGRDAFIKALTRELNRQIGRETTFPTSGQVARGKPLSRLTPLRCLSCNRTLIHLEPVDPPDNFDYYVCRRGYGTFRYFRLAHRDSASSP